MVRRTLSLITVQGERDRNVVAQHQRMDNPPCSITLVYSDGENRLEVAITDWAEVGDFPAQVTVEF